MAPTPTEQMTKTLQGAFDYFNEELFEGTLPQVLLTLQRRRRAFGFFHQDNMVEKGSMTPLSEIALNPETFSSRSSKEILSTLAHEMCHLWQCTYGTPSNNGYHNAEWADMMEDIGLIPSTTGMSGGKRVGMNCSHYILEDGDFDIIADEFLEMQDEPVIFEDIARSAPRKSEPTGSRKSTFACPSCNAKAWGKPSLDVLCGACHVPMHKV